MKRCPTLLWKLPSKVLLLLRLYETNVLVFFLQVMCVYERLQRLSTVQQCRSNLCKYVLKYVKYLNKFSIYKKKNAHVFLHTSAIESVFFEQILKWIKLVKFVPENLKNILFYENIWKQSHSFVILFTTRPSKRSNMYNLKNALNYLIPQHSRWRGFLFKQLDAIYWQMQRSRRVVSHIGQERALEGGRCRGCFVYYQIYDRLPSS